MKGILAAIVSNWKLKTLAIALAVLLWVVVSGDQIVTSEEVATVEVVNRDEGVRLVQGPIPSEVTVRFVGPRREFYAFLAERPQVRLTIDEVEEASGEFALTPGMVVVPRGSDVTPQEVRPTRVHLSFERLATRTVPVRPRLPERVDDRYIVDQVRVEPRTVQVSGPAERITHIDELATRPITLEPGDTVFERTVPLDLQGLDRLRFSHTEVRVAGRLEALVENVLRNHLVHTPVGTFAQPAEVRLTYEGARRTVAQVDPGAVRVRVDADALPSKLPAEGVDVPVLVEGLPETVEARVEPQRVRLFPVDEADPDEDEETDRDD